MKTEKFSSVLGHYQKFIRLENGILATADVTAQKIILPRLAALAAEIDEMFQALENHSCNYKIGHPLVTSPCPICLLVEKIRPDSFPPEVEESFFEKH